MATSRRSRAPRAASIDAVVKWPVGVLPARIDIMEARSDTGVRAAILTAWDRTGREHRMTARADGDLWDLFFEPLRPRGAQPKHGRNVACALAWRLYMAGEQGDRRAVEARARASVLQLWTSRGWRGMGGSGRKGDPTPAGDESSANRLIRLGAKQLAGLSVLIIRTDEGDVVGAAIAAPPDAFRRDPKGALVAVDGVGWLWRPEMGDTAEHGLIAAEITLDPP